MNLDDVDALTIHPLTGVRFAVQNDPIPGILYTVDKNTGETTHITDPSFPVPDPLKGRANPHIDGIAFDPNTGVLYGTYSNFSAIEKLGARISEYKRIVNIMRG